MTLVLFAHAKPAGRIAAPASMASQVAAGLNGLVGNCAPPGAGVS